MGEQHRLALGLREQMKGEALGGLLADAGKLGQLLDEPDDRLRGRHRVESDYMSPGMTMPVIFASSVSRSFFAFLIPSFTAARTRSSSIPLSSGLITSFSILMSTISSVPFTFTLTMPPPAAASTTRSLRSVSSFWSLRCMSSNVLPYLPIPPAGN